MNGEIFAKARLGNIFDTITPRFPLWKEHAKNIGEDFLAMFDRHIEPYCNHISDNSKVILYGRLNVIFEGLARRTEQEIITAKSRSGRLKEGVKSDTLVSNGIYTDSISKYRGILNAKIVQHNFEVSHRESQRIIPNVEAGITEKSLAGQTEKPQTETTKTVNEEDRVHEAVSWCYGEYKKQKASGNKKINQRSIAREAVRHFFPELKGEARRRMIDNVRNSYLIKLK